MRKFTKAQHKTCLHVSRQLTYLHTWNIICIIKCIQGEILIKEILGTDSFICVVLAMKIMDGQMSLFWLGQHDGALLNLVIVVRGHGWSKFDQPSKRPKSVISGNLSKNGCVWATQWPTPSELKIKFDPLLNRSWCEFFRLWKILFHLSNDGAKLGCNENLKVDIRCKISFLRHSLAQNSLEPSLCTV